MEGKYIVFRIGNESMGVPIESVERILPSQAVSRIPRSPKSLSGMFHHAGESVPVVDGAIRFDLTKVNDYGHLLVLQTEQGRYALQVESVDRIAEFKAGDFDEPKSWMASVEPGLVIGVGKQADNLYLLLRPEAIVPADLQKKLDKLAVA
jgi:purine-binding chemotaxis protein CheW